MPAAEPATFDWRPWLAGLGLCALVMSAVWAIQALRRDATIVDVAWAASLGSLAVLYACLADGDGTRRAAIGVLGAIWSARLAGWLGVHRLGSAKPEDARYAELRRRWGASANRNFFVFFQAQGILAVVLSTPFLLIASNARDGFAAAEIAGALVALLAIAGETTADVQLERFKRDPSNRGRTCRDGLWRLSRHPNYFFEWLYWLGVAAIALAAPLGPLGLVAPALMLWLLWKVTGIPAAEAQAVKSRGADYLDYQRTTSAFVPWFPRSAR